jgi:hypothetical protein
MEIEESDWHAMDFRTGCDSQTLNYTSQHLATMTSAPCQGARRLCLVGYLLQVLGAIAELRDGAKND